MTDSATWLRSLATRGGKGSVGNINARALGRVADEIDALRHALRLHHDWQLNIGEMDIPFEDGSLDSMRVDLSAEYKDSGMCKATRKALCWTSSDSADEAMNEELKPCPFCGGQPWRAGYTVQCHDCGAQVIGPSGQADADEKWNSRTSDSESKDTK